MDTKQRDLGIPINALRFSGKGKVTGSLSMVAYSGGKIKAHPYWGDLAINLEGMKLNKDKYPILENHDVSKKVGFVERGQIQKNGNLRVRSGVILDTPSGQEFSRLSKDGYPWQSSIYAKPSVIEKISEGEKVSLNGNEFSGPLTIWAACELKEISVVTLGWDSETSAEAFTQNIHTLSLELRGFDEDEILANRIFAATQGGRKSEPLDVSDEDSKLADEIFESVGQGQGDISETLSDEDSKLADSIFAASGRL